MARKGSPTTFLPGFLILIVHGMISGSSLLAEARRGAWSNQNDLPVTANGDVVWPVLKVLRGSDHLGGHVEGEMGVGKMGIHDEAPKSDADEQKDLQNGGSISGNNAESLKIPFQRQETPSNYQKMKALISGKNHMGISRETRQQHPPTPSLSSSSSTTTAVLLSSQEDSKPPSMTTPDESRSDCCDFRAPCATIASDKQRASQGTTHHHPHRRHHQIRSKYYNNNSFMEPKRALLDESAAEELDHEIVNLLVKDYNRGPPKGKRKPPINNHEIHQINP